MSEQKIVDHLFRHQYGKMVSVLTRIFGLAHLETIEDAVQDTFVKAMLTWRNQLPDNPEAWLTQAAKNRVIDLFRKLQTDQKRIPKIDSGPSVIALREMFLDTEIEDSQLRMIFTACHPALNPKDQLSFSLKTISGFSSREIASALLLKEETIKKRLHRARKAIREKSLSFEIPQGDQLPQRLHRVLEVLYLIFNEGFHSSRKDQLVRKELCGEAMRLCKMLLKNEFTNKTNTYALFALMCFQAARLDTKTNEHNELIDIKNQDRTKWFLPLIQLGNRAMSRAVETDEFTLYHYEAAIAAEHLKAPSFEQTDWDKILHWYDQLYALQSSPFILMNKSIIQLQQKKYDAAYALLQAIVPGELEQRAYLYYGTCAEYFSLKGQTNKAIDYFDKAIASVKNESEKQYLIKKKEQVIHSTHGSKTD